MWLPDQIGATRLVLVRHAETDGSASGLCYGRLDVSLSARGRAQARELAGALRELPLAVVYASPLSRALETARAIAAAHGLEPLIHPDLAELDFGELEGLPYDRIAAERPDFFARWMDNPAGVRFPGGESLAELRARALPAIAKIRERHEGKPVAVVAHAGVLRVVLADALELGEAALFRIDQPHAAVSIIDWVEGVALVRAINALVPASARAS